MDNYEYEEIVQEPRNLISDGATDEMLQDEEFTQEQIEAAHVNYLALYFKKGRNNKNRSRSDIFFHWKVLYFPCSPT